MFVEIIVTSLEEAILAERFGAHRLELIDSFALGGRSPSLELSKAVSSAVSIPVNIMLRPHGNSFNYNAVDMEQILTELEYLRDNTLANGVVFGCLTPYLFLDKANLQLVINNKGRLKFTFHRAIDVSFNPLQTYTELLNFSEVDEVLTSGGKDTALEGISAINAMLELKGNHNNCEVLVGSGITPENVKQIINSIPIERIHLGTGIRENSLLSKDRFDLLFNNLKMS